jgi:hypothetical protein
VLFDTPTDLLDIESKSYLDLWVFEAKRVAFDRIRHATIFELYYSPALIPIHQFVYALFFVFPFEVVVWFSVVIHVGCTLEPPAYLLVTTCEHPLALNKHLSQRLAVTLTIVQAYEL